jgi:simple sugar transport system ATP-binding protein
VQVIVARVRPRRQAGRASPSWWTSVIEYIHSQIVEQRDQGAAVLIVSSELDEVMAISDRVLVMYRGRIVAEFDPATSTKAEIGLAMLGSGAAHE